MRRDAVVDARAPAGATILCLPYHATLCFLSGRRNPTRWNYLWPGDQGPEDHRALVGEAESDPPAVVLLANEASVALYAPGVVDWVKARYVQVDSVGKIAVYARR